MADAAAFLAQQLGKAAAAQPGESTLSSIMSPAHRTSVPLAPLDAAALLAWLFNYPNGISQPHAVAANPAHKAANDVAFMLACSCRHALTYFF